MGSNHKETDFIPDMLYQEIVKYLPIVSVEALLVIDSTLLFLRRNNEPAKGEWWFAGGRVRKGESFEQTLRREVKEETVLQVSSHKFVNVYSRVFSQRHDITLAYLCKCKGEITVDKEHSEYKLFRNIPANLHPFLLETIRDSQWEKE